ncbi:MAG: DUF2080 family transposase-associated protein [Thermoplasmata archaeon]|jgi:putative transposon-encoded protein|nr:DUF2080 family transposase-associated protein [Candidatus Sysuiplasma jiujiangense]
MSRHVEFVARSTLRVEGILGFMKRKVVRYGTGAAVICPKEYLGKTAFLVIAEEQWKNIPAKEGRKRKGGA